MPNWVYNELTVESDNAERVEAVRAKLFAKDEDGNDKFSFAVLLPEERDNPEYRIYPDDKGSIDITKVDERVDAEGRKHYFNWYKFNCDKWGTKWDADNWTEGGVPNKIKVSFDTAWCEPDNWYAELCRAFPDVKISMEVDDIAWCKVYRYENGKHVNTKTWTEDEETGERIWIEDNEKAV